MTTNDETRMTALISTELPGDDLPARILIAPWGEVHSSNGDFIVDEQAALAAIAQFREHGTDLPIDFEHQTLGGSFSSPDGLAPAAGWIRDLASEPAVGLLADVQWTPRGVEQLRTRQYRYLSPVAIIRSSDRRMIGLHSAALTNKPAIAGMAAIVNKAQSDVPGSTADTPMSIGVARADQSQHEEHTMLEALNNLRAQLDLDGGVTARQVLLTASQRLAELHDRELRQAAEDRVTAALACGKLTEAQRDWAAQLARKDAQSFDAWLAAAPVVVSPGRTMPPDPDDAAAQIHRAHSLRARQEYRTDPLLQALTSEEAYAKYAT